MTTKYVFNPITQKLDQTYVHGPETDPSHHAIATESENGFMVSSDKFKLNRIAHGWLQYTNSATNSTTATYPAFSPANMNVDFNSFPNGLFTKPNATDFVTSFSGHVKVSYKAEMQNDTNDRAFMAVVIKNGTPLAPTKARNIAKNNTDRYGSVAGSFILSCAPGDIFRMGFTNAEGNTPTYIYADGAVFLVESYYIN